MATKPKAQNPYHGNTEYTELKASDWVEFWKDNKTYFHKTEPQALLVKHLDKLVNGRTGITVFFPLCGKTVDMKFVYDAGHSVVGVDIADQALKEFFTENKIEYTMEKVDKISGQLFKSTDGRIRLYCADLYNFSSDIESGMQGIFDRGGLVAINLADRQRYADLMMTLMAKDCQYLLLGYNYDPEKYAGPPQALSKDHVNQLFGERCKVETLEHSDALQAKQRDQWGLDWYEEDLHLLAFK